MGLFLTIIFFGIGIIAYVFEIKQWYENRFDLRGFDKKSGIHRNGTLYDDNGYDKNGYDRDGYGIDGYNRVGFDKDGYHRDGYNLQGFDKNGYNKQGYNCYGYNIDGYDKFGYDINGYNEFGFNKDGYDIQGFDKNGYNKQGYNCYGYKADGFNEFGYDINGYNKSGFNKDGYDTDGYNIDGYDAYNNFNRFKYFINSNKINSLEGFYNPKHFPIIISKHAQQRIFERLKIKNQLEMKLHVIDAYCYGQSIFQVDQIVSKDLSRIESKGIECIVLLYKKFIYIFSAKNKLITVYEFNTFNHFQQNTLLINELNSIKYDLDNNNEIELDINESIMPSESYNLYKTLRKTNNDEEVQNNKFVIDSLKAIDKFGNIQCPKCCSIVNASYGYCQRCGKNFNFPIH